MAMSGTPTLQRELERAAAVPLQRPGGRRFEWIYDAENLMVRDLSTGSTTHWSLQRRGESAMLECRGNAVDTLGIDEMAVAFEASFLHCPDARRLDLQTAAGSFDALLQSGLAARDESERICIVRDMFWQRSEYWRENACNRTLPLRYAFTQGRRHPLREPKPDGLLYTRSIPWLRATLSFRVVDPEGDIARFHRWMNDPAVDAFWQEAGDVGKHRAYLAAISSDPHVIGVVGCFDDDPFGYFEIYWAKEDRIAPFCDADDFDRGWHVLIGEPSFRGKPFVTAWLPSISHYLFLDDRRTQRIVIEPRSDNHKMIGNLVKGGYAIVKEFDFPHKRATLATLMRETFFHERL
jgi:acetyl CoA:N6-hydroxylysine acetyl transferase